MAIIYGIDVGSEKSGICIWDTQKQKILCADDQYPNHMVAQQSAHY
jgi:ribulose kinase